MQEKEILQHLVDTSESLSEILRKQNKAISGTSIKILKEKLEVYGIQYHFLNYNHANKNKLSLQDKLQEGTNVKSSDLKNLLIKEKLKENKCEICGQLPEWNGKPLVLQLDHINGNHYDNRLENLRIVCPNCHTQTNTFSNKKVKKSNKCIDCGCEISSKSTRCRKCAMLYNKQQQSNPNKPSKEELFELIKQNSFVSIGKMFNVSDNTIRKWCKSYNLPYTKKELRLLK